jgi:hypothetical protein
LPVLYCFAPGADAMSMSRREQHELREIECTLSLADPGLASLLSSPRRSTEQVARALACTFVAVAVLLLAVGAVLTDAGMVMSECLVLLMLPPAVWLYLATHGREP